MCEYGRACAATWAEMAAALRARGMCRPPRSFVADLRRLGFGDLVEQHFIDNGAFWWASGEREPWTTRWVGIVAFLEPSRQRDAYLRHFAGSRVDRDALVVLILIALTAALGVIALVVLYTIGLFLYALVATAIAGGERSLPAVKLLCLLVWAWWRASV